MKVNIPKIVDLMCEKKMNQLQLAHACGVQTKTINAILTGKSNPKIETIGKLADCFGCKPSELVYAQETRG